MRKSLMLIINPVSGKGQAKTAMFDILSVFSESDYAVTVFMTGKKGDAEEMARNESGKFDVVVCVGGDGTLSEVMSGLMQAEAPPPLGYIPVSYTHLDVYKRQITENICNLLLTREHTI